MKKIFKPIALLLLCCISITSYSQMVGELFTGTIKPGTSANSVILAIKPSATFSGQFTNVQFMVQVPNTVVPQPTATIKSNPLSANIPTANYTTQVSNESGFYNYLFSATTAASPAYNFTSGTEINAIEIQFGGGPLTLSTVRFGHLADGGSTGQLAFYVEVSGNDNTNYTTMFYGSGATNGGSYSSYSYVPLGNVALPLNIVNFNAVKNGGNALLSWVVENQSANNSYYVVERSFTGTTFEAIGNVNATLLQSTYNYTDALTPSVSAHGIIYYRLREVDVDGNYTYSSIRNIKLDNRSLHASVYPNPVISTTNVTFDISQAQNVTISILDAVGKTLRVTQVAGNNGINQQRLDLSSFSSGNYIISIQAGGNTYNLPVIKTK